jgi:hypothetical protein
MNKTQIQGLVAVVTVIGLILITLVNLVWGKDRELTMLLLGGVISIASAASAWVFPRDGSGGKPNGGEGKVS